MFAPIEDFEHEMDELELTFPETEAIAHFLGFDVHKFRSKYPDLGSGFQETDGNSNGDAYITRGGLKVMKPHYRDAFLHLEGCFMDYHGTSLCEGEAAIENVLQVAQTQTVITVEVAAYYIHCRIYFRIKQLNNKLKEKNTRPNNNIVIPLWYFMDNLFVQCIIRGGL